MLDKSKAKIFLAAERGCFETKQFRSYTTFNFHDYLNEHKSAFGSLNAVNDVTLGGGVKRSFVTEGEACTILLPTVGAVIYTDDIGNFAIVQAGEVLICNLPGGARFEIENPFEKELVNLLHLWVNQLVGTDRKLQKVTFNLDQNKDLLLPIYSDHLKQSAAKIIHSFIGKFKGRSESSYKPNSPGNKIFAFVLEGAFEVQNRLLEAKDGLALWDIAEVEFEALSNDAIILILDMS